jgi:hypothetical protein
MNKLQKSSWKAAGFFSQKMKMYLVIMMQFRKSIACVVKASFRK